MRKSFNFVFLLSPFLFFFFIIIRNCATLIRRIKDFTWWYADIDNLTCDYSSTVRSHDIFRYYRDNYNKVILFFWLPDQ